MVVEAQPYLTESVDVNPVINERVGDYSEIAGCFFDPAIPFTLATDVSTYDLRGAAFDGKRICDVQDITIDKRPLYDLSPQPRRGSIGWADLIERYPNYQTDASQAPKHWLNVAPQSVMLYPTPDQVYSDCFVSGYYMHPDMDDDADLILLPQRLIRFAAKFVAATLMDPRKGGSSAERVDGYNQEAYGAAAAFKRDQERRNAGPRIKGKAKDGYGCVRIG